MLELDDFAKDRMNRHNLSISDVEHIIDAQCDGTGKQFLLGTLPDGRTVKVRMVNGVVADAFVLH